jgi:hypothetical protein
MWKKRSSSRRLLFLEITKNALPKCYKWIVIINQYCDVYMYYINHDSFRNAVKMEFVDYVLLIT